MTPVMKNTSALKRGRTTNRGCFLAKTRASAISKTTGYVQKDKTKAYTWKL